MKKLAIGLVLPVLMIAGCNYPNYPDYPTQNQPSPPNVGPNTPLPEINTVHISNYKYNPQTLRIHAGQTITWINDDPAGHTVSFNGFGSKTLKQGQIYKHQFKKPGEYSYHSTIQPKMRGWVIVQ